MAQKNLDLANEKVAMQVRNKTAIIGMTTMYMVLALAYVLEVVKGVRTIGSYLIVAALPIPEDPILERCSNLLKSASCVM